MGTADKVVQRCQHKSMQVIELLELSSFWESIVFESYILEQNIIVTKF